MEKKSIYMMFFILGLLIFPGKLALELTNPVMIKALWFVISYVFVIFIMMVISSKKRLVPKSFHPTKNILLSSISLLCSGTCAWSAYAYFQSVKPKDLKVQYSLLMVFCALSALFFIFVSKAHLSGENSFKGFQLLLFALPAMYLFLISVFFSTEIGKHDMYDFFSKALTLLFFVYYTQNYVSFKDVEHKRNRMVTFGLPASLVTFGYFFSHINSFPFGSAIYVSNIMNVSISLYIISFLLTGPLAMNDQLEPAKA